MKFYFSQKTLSLLTLLIVLFSACSKESADLEPELQPELQIESISPGQTYTTDQIDGFIIKNIQKNQAVFNWKSVSDEMLYSALQESDQILAIGYKTDRATNVAEWIGTEETLPKEWLDKRDAILNKILAYERVTTENPELTLEEILPFGLDEKIPTIAIKVESFALIQELRNDGSIRYVEPMGYFLGSNNRSDSGCGSAPDYNLNGNDYTNTSSYNAKISWVHGKHNVTSAWNHSTGDNIGICIIDTGASDDQNNLGSQFNSGASTGRNIQKYSTKYSGSWWWKSLDSPHDQCGHGTSMAGLAAAPWSTDGNAVGVAYKSDLTTVRAVEDVIINTSNEKEGVKDALEIAGDQSGIKIVSMSLGTPFWSGTVADGIYYANNNGVLIFAAAGTSTSFTNWYGVIFPASMSQTTAVTGIKDQSNYERCDVCHSGDEVDFTIIMERANDNDRHSISLATYSDQPNYVGGSSCATATTAGIAALVWATNPNMSKNTVKNRLKTASENYPNRDDDFGWGNINAYGAVTNTGY